MKSCLGILIMSTVLALILGGGGLLYYLSSTTEFERVAKVREAQPEPAR